MISLLRQRAKVRRSNPIWVMPASRNTLMLSRLASSGRGGRPSRRDLGNMYLNPNRVGRLRAAHSPCRRWIGRLRAVLETGGSISLIGLCHDLLSLESSSLSRKCA